MALDQAIQRRVRQSRRLEAGALRLRRRTPKGRQPASVPHLHEQLPPLRSREGTIESVEPPGSGLDQHLLDAREIVIVVAGTDPV